MKIPFSVHLDKYNESKHSGNKACNINVTSILLFVSFVSNSYLPQQTQNNKNHYLTTYYTIPHHLNRSLTTIINHTTIDFNYQNCGIDRICRSQKGMYTGSTR